jgi:hypothetical protein
MILFLWTQRIVREIRAYGIWWRRSTTQLLQETIKIGNRSFYPHDALMRDIDPLAILHFMDSRLPHLQAVTLSDHLEAFRPAPFHDAIEVAHSEFRGMLAAMPSFTSWRIASGREGRGSG